VTWESQRPEIATVSASGEVTGVAPGSTTITATSGGVHGTMSISVLGPIVSVRLTPAPAIIAVGEEALWGVKARDAGGTLMELPDPAWRSDDPAIAVAGPDGRILGVRPGTTEITTTVEGVTARARLTVTVPLDLSGNWSMHEHFGGAIPVSCAASGPVVLDQGHSSPLVEGTYDRTGSCVLFAGSLDITGAVAIHGTIAGDSVSLQSSAIYFCYYRGLVSGDSANRVEGRVTCEGLPGTPDDGSYYSGSFTLTK
jgi:hypothetical protein